MNAIHALLLTTAAMAAALSSPAQAQTPNSRGHRPVRPVSQPFLSVAPYTGPVGYLLAARSETLAARYVVASEALGRAETGLINHAAIVHATTPPFLVRALTDGQAARGSAVAWQRIPTLQAIDDALFALEVQPAPLASAAISAPPATHPGGYCSRHQRHR